MIMNYAENLGKRLANFNHVGYGSFQPNGIRGQCVWYVRGRAWEKCSADTKITGNADKWIGQAKSKGLKTGNSVCPNSIACFNRGSFGHVIFVEFVDGGTVYYTEANSNGDNKVSADDGVLKLQSMADFVARAGYAGCIYLTENKNESEEFEVVKTWKNGSTKEKVFAETSLKTHIGTLDPQEACDCLGVTNGKYLVKYKISGTNDYKTGFVAYSGGVK